MPEIVFPGLRLVEGPNIRPTTNLSSGQRRRAVEIRLGFVAETAGRFVLNSVPISVAGQVFSTPEKLIEIGLRNDPSRVPFLSRWIVPSGPLLAGQSAIVTLEIYNIDEFVYPSRVTVNAPAQAIFEEVQGLGRNRTREIDGTTLYEIPVAVFMVTPSAAGSINLESAEVEWSGMVARTGPARIEVLEPPAEIAASGAIGTFSISASVNSRRVAASETLNLSIRLEGVGNLHFLSLPDVTLDGFTTEREERLDRFDPAPDGYSGYVEERIVLRPSEYGAGRITFDQFAFYDPERARVVRTQLPPFDIEITALRQPVAQGHPDIGFTLLTPAQISQLEPRNWYRNPLAYGFFAPGLLIFVSSRLWRRRPPTSGLTTALLFVLISSTMLPVADLERAATAYESGDLDKTIGLYETALRNSPGSPGINHNLAVLYFQVGDTGRAVYAAREAVRLAPYSTEIRTTQELIEEASGLEQSVAVRHWIHPDVAFFILAALFNAFFLLLAFAPRRSAGRLRGVLAIGQILMALAVLGGLAFLLSTARAHDAQAGVVREDVSLRRIPSMTAESWLDLEAGTALEIVASRDGFVLVRTALELEGWVSSDQVLYPDNPYIDTLRFSAPTL